MNNILAALLAIAASAILVGIMLLTYRGPQLNSNETPLTQTPTVFVSEGKMIPKVVNVGSQELVQMLIINNGSHTHEIVLAHEGADRKKTMELRRAIIEPGLTQNWTLRLSPGEYTIYCAIKDGVHEHRKMGEEAKLIVH